MISLFTNWRLIGTGLLTLGIVGSLALGYIHYNNLVNERDALRQREIQYQGAIESQNKLIENQEFALNEWKAVVNDFRNQLEQTRQIAQEASEESRRLRGIFGRHDLESLARAKPGLIERRINDGTANIGRLLECASGIERQDCPSGGETSDTSTDPGTTAGGTD